jgi:hypothetical protein
MGMGVCTASRTLGLDVLTDMGVILAILVLVAGMILTFYALFAYLS